MDLEVLKTEARFTKNQERLEIDFGWASTVGPMAITTNFIQTLADEVPNYLVPMAKNEEPFIDLIKNLPKETIALSCLTSGLNIIGSSDRSFSHALTRFGKDLEGECYASGLLDHDKKLFQRLDNLARQRHGNLKYRKQAVRSIAKKNSFVKETWTHKQCTIAGNWAMNLVTTVLPQVFSLVIIDDYNAKELALTEDAFDLAEEAIRQAIHAKPVFLPTPMPPVPWTDWDKGGNADKRLRRRSTLLRSRHSETAAYVRAAIAEGTMQPALDALNQIQSVGYRINERVLEVIKWFHTNEVFHPGLPEADLELPKRDKPWDQMDPDEQKVWKIEANKTKKTNRGLKAERVLLQEDLITAEYLLAQGAFYTACNLDFRGRVYPLPHFNFQREDRVRALFEFSEGTPMTEDGLYWLKVHLANVGDFDKISKKSFAERVEWVDASMVLIRETATMPHKELSWIEADKPFLFLAACIELCNALDKSDYVTFLPISLDGSCSGLQHLCAMTRASEGALVNLSHSDVPQDIYSVVADRVTENLIKKSSDPGATTIEVNLCTLCLDFGITRKIVKRNVMTYGYSSQKFGMATQLLEDLMRPLALEVLKKKRPHHPFGSDNGFIASRFLAAEIFSAIEEVVRKPAEAMSLLRHLAKACAHENKPAFWLTPVGIPWINRYHHSTKERVVLWLNDRGVTLSHSVGVSTGFTSQINKVKAANSISPNFVHALDASHLMMTVSALAKEGIPNVAVVHDSFGVLAPNAARLGVILRKEFVRLYTEFDPLQDILKSNLDRMANPSRLPAPLTMGPLDIKEILNARYAFA